MARRGPFRIEGVTEPQPIALGASICRMPRSGRAFFKRGPACGGDARSPGTVPGQGTSFATRLANEGGEATVQGTLMLANGERVLASFQLAKEGDYTEPLDHTAPWMLLGYRIGDLQVIGDPR